MQGCKVFQNAHLQKLPFFFGSTKLTVDVDLKVIVGWVEEEKLLGMQ
jgi:hypothetical protein